MRLGQEGVEGRRHVAKLRDGGPELRSAGRVDGIAPPPCGEGLGVGRLPCRRDSPSSLSLSPHEGGGNARRQGPAGTARCASAKPLAERLVSGVPPAPSAGGGGGLPDLPREGRGRGVVSVGLLGGAGHGGDIWRVVQLTSSARTRRRRRLLTTNAEGSSATKVAANRCLVHEVDGSSKSCGRGGRRATLDWLFGRLRVVAWRLRRVGALGDRGRGHRASVGVASPILVACTSADAVWDFYARSMPRCCEASATPYWLPVLPMAEGGCCECFEPGSSLNLHRCLRLPCAVATPFDTRHAP